MNDKYMKNAAAEIHKLRKEKQQLKLNSVPGSGLKGSQSHGIGRKTDKLKDVLVEIEKVSAKRFFFRILTITTVVSVSAASPRKTRRRKSACSHR